MNHRAYAVLTVKAVDEDKRVITGVATTPEPDRLNDIVEPLGITFRNPLPLLWQHKSDQPIGIAKLHKPTKDGVTFEATLPKIEEPGPLKDRVDTAWGEIKARLVRGISIGFRAIEHAVMDNGGWRFLRSEILEISCVTIPAQIDARIETIKQFDTGLPAASGTGKTVESPPGASGKSHSIDLRPKDATKMKTIAEQISALEANRATKATRLEAVLQKSSAEGRTTDKAEQEESDTLQGEIDAIDADLERFRKLEKAMAKKATPVTQVQTEEEGTKLRAAGDVVVRTPHEPEKGIRFARYARCVGLAKGNIMHARELAEELYKDDPVIANVLKAAVAAGATVSGNWAANLVGAESQVFADFAEFLRPSTILGKFGSDGNPSLRRVPFRTALLGQTGGGAAYWVGEGKPKPMTSFTFGRTTLVPLKVANIAVVTQELLRSSSPSAEGILRDSLRDAIAERLDIDFIDPAKAVSAGISPASITNGITPIPSVGNSADSIRADIQAVFAAFIAANNTPTTGVWIMPSTVAMRLSTMFNALGQPEFPGISMRGGVLFGIPVITSEYVPGVSAGQRVVLVNASDIYFADEGGVEVDMSTEASLEMLDNPTNASTATVTPTAMVSMFQTNSAAFRAERIINWARRRDTGVQVLSAVNWGEGGT